jgi:hypothetical protein
MKMSVKQWIGMFLKIGLAVIVLSFEITLSLEFFTFVYPPEKWYMAYLGLGLTSGAMLVYMYLFAFDTKSNLQKVLSLLMMVASIFAAIITAGFGMQVEAWNKAGFVMAQSDIDFMILAIRLLLFVHGIVLALYFTGDKIVTALGDDDGDGIPNFVDKDYKEWKRQKSQQNMQPVRQFGKDDERAELKDEKANPQNPPR